MQRTARRCVGGAAAAAMQRGVEHADAAARLRLVFPGGGVYFYWQAGVVEYLRERHYDLSDVELAGGSAGAIAATLTAAGVSFETATHRALDLAEAHEVWARPRGLQGVWGKLIEQWLSHLLPENAHRDVSGRLTILVTPVPAFSKIAVSEFASNRDLVACNLTSAHLPWFLDGRLTRKFRGQHCVDGHFLARDHHYANSSDPHRTVLLDWKADPRMQQHSFVSTLSRDGVWGVVEAGRSHAAVMEREGRFAELDLL